jgi:hypothetical protein
LSRFRKYRVDPGLKPGAAWLHPEVMALRFNMNATLLQTPYTSALMRVRKRYTPRRKVHSVAAHEIFDTLLNPWLSLEGQL